MHKKQNYPQKNMHKKCKIKMYILKDNKLINYYYTVK